MSRPRKTAGHPAGGGRTWSYDVRIWSIRTYNGSTGTTYTVRWIVGGEEQRETFNNRALADSRRAELLSYAKKGVRFEVQRGLPEPEVQQMRDDLTWFDVACEFVDKKWPNASGKHRSSIADALTTVTMVLIRDQRPAPDPEAARALLYQWAFNAKARQAAEPDDPTGALAWLRKNSLTMPELDDPAAMRTAIEAVSTRQDGTRAAASTMRRKYMNVHCALNYAVEQGYLQRNPLAAVSVPKPKTAEAVDRRRVVNPDQARALIDAVGTIRLTGPHLKAFFGCVYFAAMRPGEVAALREHHLELPPEGDADAWGTIHVQRSNPSAGTAWTDTGTYRDDRGLKHRPVDEVRPVPACPELVKLLREHLKVFGVAKDGRLFRGYRGPYESVLSESNYCRIWDLAREQVLTRRQYESPLAEVPYDLRHAAVSLWLNSGLSPQQVAEWAGHSVAVLLRVYAKCLDGEETAARKRLGDALRPASEPVPDSPQTPEADELGQ